MPRELHEPGWPLRLEQTTKGAPLPEAGSLTLAVLPDTQYYVSCRSAHLRNQAEWLAAQVQPRNIGIALTLGDLTDHNERPEWAFLKESLAPALEALPFIFTVGNHDYGLQGSANHRTSFFDEYVPKPGPQLEPALARTMLPGKLENAYYRFAVTRGADAKLSIAPLGASRLAAQKPARQPTFVLAILSLEWGPRASTVAWANQVLKEFPSDQRVFVSHAYLYFDDTRYDFATRGSDQKWNPLAYGTQTNEGEDATSHDGEMLWKELIEPDSGFFLTLSGHVLGDGSAKLSSQNRAGLVVHQLLANYQMLDEGGLGYLRLLELSPSGNHIRVHTFSPSLNLSSHAPDQEFDLELNRSLFEPNSAKRP